VTAWPMLTHLSPVRPSGLYGVSKVWGEALGRQYADTHGLSVICVRIGRVHAQDRPLSPREFSVWCSQRDIARLFMRCLEASPALPYEIVFGNSRNKWGYRDLEHTRAVLGWEPVDAAANYRCSPAAPQGDELMALQTRYLFTASMDVEPTKEALFNEVYDTEHVPLLLKVPGVIAVARLKKTTLTMIIGGAKKTILAEKVPPHPPT